MGPRNSPSVSDTRGSHRHRAANVIHFHACSWLANFPGGLHGELILTFIADTDF